MGGSAQVRSGEAWPLLWGGIRYTSLLYQQGFVMIPGVCMQCLVVNISYHYERASPGTVATGFEVARVRCLGRHNTQMHYIYMHLLRSFDRQLINNLQVSHNPSAGIMRGDTRGE
jgi:hypothetical protein